MGRGNVCVHGEYEGLYYVSKEYLDEFISKEDSDNIMLLHDIYHSDASLNEFEYDEISSQCNYEDFIDNFKNDFIKKFNSFSDISGSYFGSILENELFKIQIIDNEWGYAICLIQKESSYYDNYNKENLQKRHYKNYLNGIKECLFNQFDEIGSYSGCWTHNVITKIA